MTNKQETFQGFNALRDDFEFSTKRAFDFGVWYLEQLGKPAWGTKSALLYHVRRGNIKALTGWPYEFTVGSIKALCNWLPNKQGRDFKVLDSVYLDMGRLPDTQLAQRLGVAVRTISRRRKLLEIPAFKIGANPLPAIRFVNSQYNNLELNVEIHVELHAHTENNQHILVHLSTSPVEAYSAETYLLHEARKQARVALNQAFKDGSILNSAWARGTTRETSSAFFPLDLVTPVESLFGLVETLGLDEKAYSSFIKKHGAPYALKGAAKIVSQRCPIFDLNDPDVQTAILQEAHAINPALDWIGYKELKKTYGLK